MAHSAEYTFEVETDLSGFFQPAEPDVGVGAGYEDLEAVGLFALKRTLANGKSNWSRVDLLEGVSAEARAIIEANVLKFIGDDTAQETLAEAA